MARLNLASVLIAYGSRQELITYLDEAREILHDYLAHDNSSPRRILALGNLSGTILARYQITNSADDLSQAINFCRQTLLEAPEDHSDMAGFAGRFIQALLQRFAVSGQRSDIDEARATVQKYEQLATTYGVHGDVLAYATATLLTRYASLSSSVEDHRRAVSWMETVAHDSSRRPSIRRQVSRELAQTYTETGDWLLAANTYKSAVDLLPPVSSRGDGTASPVRMEEVADLASDAAVAFIRAHDLEGALAIWERARAGIILQVLSSRDADFDRLESEDRSTATELGTLYALRESTSDAAQLLNIDRKIQSLTEEVRQRPGFDRFRLGPTARDLIRDAQTDPIAVLAVGRKESHAILVTHAGIFSTPLPGLSSPAAVRHAISLVDIMEGSSASGATTTEQGLQNALQWLGDVVVGPVVKDLNAHGISIERSTCIYWCSSGWLSTFPLHAALLAPSNTSERLPAFKTFTSAYIPTLRSITYARRSIDSHAGSRRYILAVAMTSAMGGQVGLLSAGDEIAKIQAEFPNQTRILRDAQVTRMELLTTLQEATWAHFACHAESRADSPTSSRLILGRNGHESLTVADLLAAHLPHAEFAYLSACSTANAGIGILDESLHLASAFQIAGFRRVVGTLWPIGDRFAAELSAQIYPRIKALGLEALPLIIAEAAEELYERWPSFPTRWAGLMYVGR